MFLKSLRKAGTWKLNLYSWIILFLFKIQIHDSNSYRVVCLLLFSNRAIWRGSVLIRTLFWCIILRIFLLYIDFRRIRFIIAYKVFGDFVSLLLYLQHLTFICTRMLSTDIAQRFLKHHFGNHNFKTAH